MAHWVSDGSPEIQIQDSVVNCVAQNDRDNTYSAMWVDPSLGPGVNSGDHYWTIELTDVENSAWIGLSNAGKHKKGYAGKGLFYGGNLSDGGRLLVGNFGPRPTGNVVIGLLACYGSDAKLKIYYYYNNKPLGLAFDVDSSILPDACPVVRFSSGKGIARIRKEDTIPSERTPPPKQHEGIEGPWKVKPNSVIINGEEIKPEERFDPDRVTLKISPVDGGDEREYGVHLKVINSISFRVERTEGSWKNKSGGCSTCMGSTPKYMEYEQRMTELCEDPQEVSVGEGTLVIKKGESKAEFRRYDDSPQPYSDNPFR